MQLQNEIYNPCKHILVTHLQKTCLVLILKADLLTAYTDQHSLFYYGGPDTGQSELGTLYQFQSLFIWAGTTWLAQSCVSNPSQADVLIKKVQIDFPCFWTREPSSSNTHWWPDLLSMGRGQEGWVGRLQFNSSPLPWRYHNKCHSYLLPNNMPLFFKGVKKQCNGVSI